MAYRWNGVECDTFEELQRLQGVARTMSAVVKETREKKCKVKGKISCRHCGSENCNGGTYCPSDPR
mgnify:CR=1 FL=1